MTRTLDRQKAIGLRKQGKTYSEIKQKLNISKSTLSDWLSNYQLTENQLRIIQRRIKKKKIIAIERYRNTMFMKRKTRLNQTYMNQKKIILPLSERELEIAGLFLYWGEGNKRIDGPLSINNTDPQVLKYTLYWFVNVLKIPQNKIKVNLHLYSDMNIYKEVSYWSQELKLHHSSFSKPYIKQSRRNEIDQKGFGHGTCGLAVNNVRLKEKIMMSIKALVDNYSQLASSML